MQTKTYLLLGWKPTSRTYFGGDKKRAGDLQNLPGSLLNLAVGDAKTVIRAACEAECGVLLFDATPENAT